MYQSRLNQELELAKFIHSKMEKVAKTMEANEASKALDKHSFVLCGDFNVKANMVFHPSTVKWSLIDTRAEKWIESQKDAYKFKEQQFLENCFSNDWSISTNLADDILPPHKKYDVSDVYREYMSRPSVNFNSDKYLDFFNKIHSNKSLSSQKEPETVPSDPFIYPDTSKYSIKPGNFHSQFVSLNSNNGKIDYIFRLKMKNAVNIHSFLGPVSSVNVLPNLTSGLDDLEHKVARMSDHNMVLTEFELLLE